MSKVELVQASAHALDPNKKYLIIFKEDQITKADISELSKQLYQEGIYNINVIIRGNEDVQIVEAQ